MLRKKCYLFLSAMVLMLQSTLIFASPAVLQVYQRCGNMEFPLRNGYLFVLNMQDQFFLSTDSIGNFILDDDHFGETIMAYLANEEDTIFPGCRSDIIQSKTGRLVLHGLCPSRNCG